MRRAQAGLRSRVRGCFYLVHCRYACKGISEIPVNHTFPLGIADHDLMQIHIIGEGSQCLASGRRWTDLQGRAQMNLAELDAVLLQPTDRILRFLEFDRQMARIVIDAQVFAQAFIFRVFRPQSVEEMNRLAAGLQQTEWFGLQTQLHYAPGLRAETGDVLDAMPEIVA